MIGSSLSNSQYHSYVKGHVKETDSMYKISETSRRYIQLIVAPARGPKSSKDPDFLMWLEIITRARIGGAAWAVGKPPQSTSGGKFVPRRTASFSGLVLPDGLVGLVHARDGCTWRVHGRCLEVMLWGNAGVWGAPLPRMVALV